MKLCWIHSLAFTLISVAFTSWVLDVCKISTVYMTAVEVDYRCTVFSANTKAQALVTGTSSKYEANTIRAMNTFLFKLL